MEAFAQRQVQVVVMVHPPIWPSLRSQKASLSTCTAIYISQTVDGSGKYQLPLFRYVSVASIPVISRLLTLRQLFMQKFFLLKLLLS